MKRAFAWATFLVLAATGACDDEDGTGAHALVAQRFDVAGDCVEAATSIDLVKGGSGALTCEAACIVLPSPPAPDAPRVYVTTMCGPYPDDYDVTGEDPACADALAAFASDDGGCGGGASQADAGDGDGDTNGDTNGDTDSGVEGDASDEKDAGTDGETGNPTDAGTDGSTE